MQLVPSKYFWKARHRGFIIYCSTLSPLSPLPDGWAITNLWNSACWVTREAHRGPVYIHPPRVCLVPSTTAQGKPLCPVVEDPQSWRAWASPSSSSSASLCSSSAPDIHPAPGRQFHPVRLEVTHTQSTNGALAKCFCTSVHQPCVCASLWGVQLQRETTWSPRSRSCGRKSTHWRRCRLCRQVRSTKGSCRDG